MVDYLQMVCEMGADRRQKLINSFLLSIEFDSRTGWSKTKYDKLFLALVIDEYQKATADTAAQESIDTQ